LWVFVGSLDNFAGLEQGAGSDESTRCDALTTRQRSCAPSMSRQAGRS
jgi:hypothetical protein